MNKRVVVISTSPRLGGNSDLLAEEFARGTKWKRSPWQGRASGFAGDVWRVKTHGGA